MSSFYFHKNDPFVLNVAVAVVNFLESFRYFRISQSGNGNLFEKKTARDQAKCQIKRDVGPDDDLSW
jgi:hypothetical protein